MRTRRSTAPHEQVGGFAALLALELRRQRALRRRARRSRACAAIDAAFDNDLAAREVATCTAERTRHGR